MKNTLSVLLFSTVLFAAPAFGQTPVESHPAAVAQSTATADDAIVQQLVQRHGDRLVRSRYMAQNCEPVAWPGWEGLPTEKCRYTVKDRAIGTTKSVEVVMLNAPPEKVARWVVTAVHDAGSTQPAVDADKLFKHIISQSGGQFPVAGVVYEDMEGDGFMKAYCFRNGVTVRVDGVTHRTTAPLTAAEIDASLRGPIERVYTYARIASTTPDQYRAAGGIVEVGTNKDRKPAWLDVVGDLYRRAWNSDRNELISAWAKANL